MKITGIKEPCREPMNNRLMVESYPYEDYDENGNLVTKHKKEPYTLQGIMYAAMMQQGQDDRTMSGNNKLILARIGNKIAMADDEVELDAMEVDKVRERVGKIFPPVMVMLVDDCLTKAEAADKVKQLSKPKKDKPAKSV